MKPNNVISRKDLTSYAFALMQDTKAILDLVSSLAPVVPTGVTDGTFNKFDTTQAFKNYQNARRAIGGQASKIEFLSTTGNFAAVPYGLRISIDQHERKRAGEAIGLLEQGKTRTLQINCLLSYAAAVIDVIKANVSAQAGKGDWSDPAVDPILELDAQFVGIYRQTGVVPNFATLDFGAWAVLKNNPKVLARMPGADVTSVTPQRIGSMLVNPNAKIQVVETSILSSGGLGNASATKAGILGGSALVHYTSATPTQYDPSAFKTFAPAASLFTEVYQYPEQPHLDWYENDWTCAIEVISALLARRIDVTGATE